MSDVRSLLRQQRAARRITHPHAAYSDAGKLLCTLCREPVKTELLWEIHVMGPGHRQRLEKLEASSSESGPNQSSNKRKHEDEDMDDVAQANEDEDCARTKRSRPDTSEPDHEADKPRPNTRGGAEQVDRDENKTPTRLQNHTPPFLRRSSGTPSQGVEMEIASRPATPVAVRTEAARARSSSNVGDTRSPLIPQNGTAPVAGFAAAMAAPAKATAALATATGGAPAPAGNQMQDILEDEWAAFEADLLTNNSAPSLPTAGAPADAVISAPAMTADELAARSAEEEQARRRTAADIEMDDEREDAARALETEFEDMEELEARVRRLKERREALRHQQGGPALATTGDTGDVKGDAEAVSKGKENAQEEEESEDEDDDDEDADDWAGFRYRR
jgi:zinc finger protein 830